ncbi:MAG: HDIG domain-containing protein [Anaerosomatales bacterium]|nr:HDIG domain-containing protein [Anaerosomatales bacterium]MDT8434812.1 HDIG domain-containing protein [Anaerosomatales bacterium]
MDREAALALVRERIPNRNLVNHCIAAEVIMEALARHLGLPEEDVARWGLAGLLHDLDYAETAEDPQRHARGAAEELAGVVDDEIVHAILAHACHVELETDMDRALYAADPLTGFVVAAALVRPDKSLAGVEVRSLKKRWKEKAFARGANREQMDTCASLGITREEFLTVALEAMQARSEELGL